MLSKDDVRVLYKSSELSESTPPSFQCRLIFGVALLTAMRPQELSLRELSQISRHVIDGVDAFIVKRKIGGTVGTCKNVRGGIKQIYKTPTEVPNFD